MRQRERQEKGRDGTAAGRLRGLAAQGAISARTVECIFQRGFEAVQFCGA